MYGKTYHITFRTSLAVLDAQFYISNTGTIFHYDSSTTTCGGHSIKLNTSSFIDDVCDGQRYRGPVKASLRNGVVTYEQKTNGVSYRFRFSSDGQTCSFLTYVLDGEAQTPVSCSVHGGNLQGKGLKW